MTISVNRASAYIDLIDKILPEVASSVAANQKFARMSLPPHFLDMGGLIDLQYDNDEAFKKRLAKKSATRIFRLQTPIKILTKEIRTILNESVESGIDEMALEFMKTALPPMLSPGLYSWIYATFIFF